MIGFLKRQVNKEPPRLPSGSFTLNASGQIVVSTMPRSFPEAQMREIGERVMDFFKGAQLARLPLQELNIYYPSLKLTARSLRGGALIFLLPQTHTKSESSL